MQEFLRGEARGVDALDKLQTQTGRHFHDIVDDQPFVYNVFRTIDFLSPSFYKNIVFGNTSLLLRFVALLLVLILLCSLILSQMNMSTKFALGSLSQSLSMTFLGFSSIMLQIILVYRCTLFFGNPTWALVLGVGLSFFTSSLGSTLVSRHWVSRKTMIFLAPFGASGWILLNLIFTQSTEWLFAMNPIWRAIVILILFLPSTFCTSLAFPFSFAQNLSTHDKSISFLFGINRLSGAVGDTLHLLYALPRRT